MSLLENTYGTTSSSSFFKKNKIGTFFSLLKGGSHFPFSHLWVRIKTQVDISNIKCFSYPLLKKGFYKWSHRDNII